jgi:hypothetical protein
MGENAKRLAELREAKNEQNRINRLEAKLNRASEGSYQRLSAQYALNKLQLNKMSKAQRESTAAGKRLEKQTRDIYEEMSRLQKATGKYQLEVGRYQNALKGFATVVKSAFLAGGVVAAVQTVGRVISDSVQTVADFNRQINFLGAVSQASAGEIESLRNQAKELGSSTQFSASQVAQLQVEYSKLGFGPAEILETTADTLNLAAVAQSDLGETATVVGATLRGFGLGAEETQRVTDVMAKSFSSSALDLNKFSVAMSAVAPVADSAGVGVERTTALLGTLVNRGLDASTAGTSLRNMFLQLSAQGLTWEEAMTKINEATDKNAVALELFGTRGATTATILASTSDEVQGLTDELLRSEGFAQNAADTMTDDLQGSLDTLKSTAEGLQIAFGELIEEGLRKLIGVAVAFLRVGIQMVEVFRAIPEFVKENRTALILLGAAIVAFNGHLIRTNALLLINNARNLLMAKGEKAAAVAKGVLTAAQRGLNLAMKANPIGLVISALALLAAGLKLAYDRSERFRAVIGGLQNVAQEFFEIMKDAFSGLQEGFEAIREGRVKDALKIFANGVAQANPIGVYCWTGEAVGDAFRDGYALSMQDALRDRAIDELKERSKSAVDEGIKPVDNAVIDLTEDLDDLDKGLADLSGGMKKAEKDTALVAGSLAALEAEVSRLESAVKNATPGNAGLISQLIKAEEAVEEAKKANAAIRNLLTTETDFLPTGPQPSGNLPTAVVPGMPGAAGGGRPQDFIRPDGDRDQ